MTDKIRAVRFHEHGGPEVFRVEEIPRPEPGEGEVRVGVRFAGVNFIDVYRRTGFYPVPGGLPAIPGAEASGVVEAVGPGVTEVAEGDRVAFWDARGAYAEAVVHRAERLLPLTRRRRLRGRRHAAAPGHDRPLPDPHHPPPRPGRHGADPRRGRRRRPAGGADGEARRRPGDRHLLDRGEGGAGARHRRRPRHPLHRAGLRRGGEAPDRIGGARGSTWRSTASAAPPSRAASPPPASAATSSCSARRAARRTRSRCASSWAAGRSPPPPSTTTRATATRCSSAPARSSPGTPRAGSTSTSTGCCRSGRGRRGPPPARRAQDLGQGAASTLSGP